MKKCVFYTFFMLVTLLSSLPIKAAETENTVVNEEISSSAETYTVHSSDVTTSYLTINGTQYKIPFNYDCTYSWEEGVYSNVIDASFTLISIFVGKQGILPNCADEEASKKHNIATQKYYFDNFTIELFFIVDEWGQFDVFASTYN